jgi:hypothetical protein
MAKRSAISNVTPAKPDYRELNERTYDIASRFCKAQAVVDVVLQYLLDNNSEGMNSELAATLELARDHMSAAHDDLDRLSTELGSPSEEVRS